MKAPVSEPTLTSEEQSAGKYYVWNEASTTWVLGTHEEHHS